MKHIALTALIFCFASSAFASGYQLRYQGAESMGTAFSSAGSYGESLSSIYYNPALFLLQGKEKAVSLELMYTHPTKAEFTSATGQVTDDYASGSISGAFYFGYKVDDETAFTVAITTPWGTASDYDNPVWDGRYHAIKTDLGAVNIQTMISKKVSDKFMFSVGPQIQYMKGELSRTTNFGLVLGDIGSSFEGDSTSVGGVLALTYTPSEKTTFGFNYTSRVKHNLRGDLKWSGNNAAVPGPAGPFVDSNDADAEITTPDVFTLGMTHKISDRLLGHFSLGYTNWSVFKELTTTAQNAVAGGLAPTSATVAQNWDDTYMVALGTTFNTSESTVLRGGLSYETGAVDNEFRTPRTQDADRIGLGLGAKFALGKVNLDLALNQIFYLGDIDLEIANTPPNPSLPAGRNGVQGTYDTSATLLRLGVEYIF